MKRLRPLTIRYNKLIANGKSKGQYILAKQLITLNKNVLALAEENLNALRGNEIERSIGKKEKYYRTTTNVIGKYNIKKIKPVLK